MGIHGKFLNVKIREPFYNNIEFVRQIGADSMVLLKNEGVLPLTVGKVALFGAGAVDTIFCGCYSNYVPNPHKVSVYEGLLNNGFTFTTEVWLSKMQKAIERAAKDMSDLDANMKKIAGVYNRAEEVPISPADLAEGKLGTNTCIYVLRRETLETVNRTYEKGDYLLSDIEEENIRIISEAFLNVIIVLNSQMVEISNLVRSKNINSIIYMGVPGMEAGNSLADIITGKVNPNGHLTDSWAKKYKDYPACSNYSKKNRNSLQVDYKEGIYVGYRYFDSFGVKPLFPFGYGLSYSKFSLKPLYLEANWFYVLLRVRVKNVGKLAGKAVVQVYVSMPGGRIEKPYQELKGFGKTSVINPQEAEELVIKIDTRQLASFSEKKSAWVMEGGEYIFRIGENSGETMVAGKVVLNKQTIIKGVGNYIKPTEKLEFLMPERPAKEETGYILTASLNSEDLRAHNKPVKRMDNITTHLQVGSSYTSYINDSNYENPFPCKEELVYMKPLSSHNFIEVAAGRLSVEEFVASLPPEVLARICCGAWNESRKETDSRLKYKFKLKKEKRFSGRTTNQYAQTLGIPGVSFMDGPAGLHMPGIKATCYPAAINIGQTWDVEAMEKVGDCYGTEMEYFDIDFCLAPAINIHRDPLAARSYEYFSEDPVLSGLMGTAFIKGVQAHRGCGVVLKHLAVYSAQKNDQEVNCNISTRALREIYLKAFEICVRDGFPRGVMNSNNKINGRYASTWRSLNLDILRAEWGFEGVVLSEWGTASDKASDIHGGCDLIMPGFNPDKLLHAMQSRMPLFNYDGYVEEVEKTTAFGKKMIVYDTWGSFLPCAEGKDMAMTTVEAGVEMNPKVLELEQEGICQITTEKNGSKTIRYKGIDRGAYMALGDLQLAAIHVLNAIKDSGTMLDLLEQSKK